MKPTQARHIVVSFVSFGEVLSSPLIQKLREQEAGILRTEAELSTKYGDKHPRMIKVRAELEDIQRTIRQEVAKVVSGLRSELVVAKAREKTLSNNLKQLQQQQARAGGEGDGEFQLALLSMADRPGEAMGLIGQAGFGQVLHRLVVQRLSAAAARKKRKEDPARAWAARATFSSSDREGSTLVI